MSKVLAVFGATGKQGGSVVDSVLNDSELSKEYTVRAISRDVNSDISVQLKKKVEVVAGDAAQPASLDTALAGVHTVFIVTHPAHGPSAYREEYDSGKAIADAAVKQGVKYIIFSTLTAVKKISGGKYTKVTNFDAKADLEQYIRSLPVKSAFVLLGEFMENFHNFPVYGLKKQPDDTYVFARSNAPTSKAPLIYSSKDVGKFVGAILANPQNYEGKVVAVASRYYSLNEIADILSKSTGKKVVYKQLSVEEFARDMPDWLADIFTEVLAFAEEYGYYGPDSEKEVAGAAANARGKLTTLEEYLAANPIKLE